jgi:hypothetical protein
VARIDGEGRWVVLKHFADACREPRRFARVELAFDRNYGFAVASTFDVQQLRWPRLASVWHVTVRHTPPLPVATPDKRLIRPAGS